MSWLSAWLDKQGNLGKTLNKVAKPVQKIANPILNNIPVVGQVKQGLELIGDYVPGAPGGEKPEIPTSGLSAKDWLGALAGGVGAGLDYKQSQSAAEELINQFARKQAQSELGTAVGAQDRINRAPMADNAQALLMARMGSAPTTFAPRDFTKGPISAQGMAAPAQGGPQDALAAARQAAASYQPGQGGVDTDALKILRDRMFKNARVGV